MRDQIYQKYNFVAFYQIERSPLTYFVSLKADIYGTLYIIMNTFKYTVSTNVVVNLIKQKLDLLLMRQILTLLNLISILK